MNNNNYLTNNLTKLYTICTIMVVLIHTNNLDLFKNNNVPLSPQITLFQDFICECLCSIAVPMFMFISAFLFYRKLKNNFSLSYIKHKFIKNCIPFLSWNTIYLFVFYLLSTLSLINTAKFEITITTLINGIIFYKYNNAFWFMFQLLLYILLSPILIKLIKNKYIGILTIISCYLAIDNIYIPKVGFYSLFYYLIGAFLAFHYEDFIITNNKQKKIKSIIIFLFCILIWFLNFFNIINISKNILILVMLLSFFFIIDFIKIPYLFNANAHFFIYSSHVFILEVLEKIFFTLFDYSNTTSLIAFLFTPILCISLCLIIFKLLTKFTPKLLYLLTGR